MTSSSGNRRRSCGNRRRFRTGAACTSDPLSLPQTTRHGRVATRENSTSGNRFFMSSRNDSSNALPSQPSPSHASAKMNPPCSTYMRRLSRCSGVSPSGSRPLMNSTGASSRSATVAACRSMVCQVRSRCQAFSRWRVRFGTPPACRSHSPSPVVLGLGHHDRPATLGKKQQRQRSRDQRITLGRAHSPPAAARSHPAPRSSTSAPSRYQSCPPMNRRPVRRPTRSRPYR